MPGGTLRAGVDAIVCICNVTQRRAEGSVPADILGGGAPVMM